MPDTDMNKRAAEIDDAVKQADAKRRADADAAGAANDEILKALRGLADTMTGLGQRMDAYETAAKSPADKDAAEAVDQDGIRDDANEPTGRKRDAAMASAQARADAVCAARGERAPPPMSGEKLSAYRRRLLRDLRHESKDFGKLDLNEISGPMFEAVEARIYSDALAASARPAVAPGQLREIKTQDISGRWISTFYGEPKAWMDEFAGNRQVLRSFKPRM